MTFRLLNRLPEHSTTTVGGIDPNAPGTPSTHSILRLKQVQARTGLSRSSIYAKMAPSGKYYDPSFPRRVKLGSKAIGWYETAVNHWLATRTCGNAIVN